MKHIFVAIILLISAASSANAGGPYNQFTIGNWTGGKMTDEKTNQFSHCAAYASYKSDITLFVSLAIDGGWYLGFAKEDWNYKPNIPIILELSFDGSPPIRVNAYPSSKKMVKVTMPVNSTLIKMFMEADVMNAYSGSNVYAFSLEGTKPLFQTLYQCWDTNRPKGAAQEARSSRPESYKPNPRVGAASPALPSSSEPDPAANSDSARERNKLIDEAVGEHHKCIRSQMREIVPYSNESAETLSQVVLTKCAEAEEKFVRLGVALFNTSRAEMEKVVQEALAVQKKNIVAEIVTFRAQLNKALSAPPKDSGGDQDKGSKDKKETGI